MKWVPKKKEWVILWDGPKEKVTTFVVEQYIGEMVYENIAPLEFLNSLR